LIYWPGVAGTPKFWIIVIAGFVVGFMLVSGLQDAVGIR